MSNAEAIKRDLKLGALLAPNVKHEPDSEDLGQLKIINVFSIQTESAVESHEGLSTRKKSCNKRIKGGSLTVAGNDEAPEATTSGRRYGLRKRSGQPSYEILDEPSHVPTSAEISKRTSNPIKEKKFVIPCDMCSIVFFSVESLEEHVIDVHVVDKEFICRKCSKSFISQDRLDSHFAEHVTEKETQNCNKCPVCSKIFASTKPYNLKKHMMTHVADKPFQCKLCPNSYTQARDLKVHEMNQHGKGKKFKCLQCSKSFARNYALEDHIRTHSKDKTMICKNCNTAFKTKHSLRNHRAYCKGTHNKCKNDLLERDVPGGNSSREEEPNEHVGGRNNQRTNNFQYKKHKCGVCNTICLSIGNLKKHMVTHSKNGRYFKNTCNLCNITFKRKQDLSTHRRVVHCARMCP